MSTEPVTYVSRISRQKFVLEGARPVRDHTGMATGVLMPGKEIQFENHKFTTADAEFIAFLDRCVGPDITKAPSAVVADLLVSERQEGPEVQGGLTTANVRQTQSVHRCRFCGRADIKSKMMFDKHEAKCAREHGAKPAGQPEGSAVPA